MIYAHATQLSTYQYRYHYFIIINNLY